MKKFEAPEMELIKFTVEDVVTTSAKPPVFEDIGDCL